MLLTFPWKVLIFNEFLTTPWISGRKPVFGNAYIYDPIARSGTSMKPFSSNSLLQSSKENCAEGMTSQKMLMDPYRAAHPSREHVCMCSGLQKLWRRDRRQIRQTSRRTMYALYSTVPWKLDLTNFLILTYIYGVLSP